MSVQFLVIYPRVDLHNCQHNRDTGQPCHHKDPPPLPLYSQITQALITPHLQQPLPRPPFTSRLKILNNFFPLVSRNGPAEIGKKCNLPSEKHPDIIYS